ncbi:uncharacterized protein LOC135503248 [Lineus longissimus]|uniref:uncharacterized protein LOC135503248 n=1 Tax=Lineus longissimus TaxID=88925 RepID=UPI00315DFE79
MAESSLSTEFECVVCSDELTQPKFIGPCNHTFCKNCIDKYWVSLGRPRTIPCPHCRQKCRIPQNGIDKLNDNFMLSSIMETYREQRQRTGKPVQVKCILCTNGASSLCKDCDFKLCPGCKGQHDHNPDTRDHELFGLCPAHGNGLLFFCNPCKQAVCSGCRVSYHNQGDHDVKPIRPVVGDLVCRIQAFSSELENAIRALNTEDRGKLMQLLVLVKQKSRLAEVQATASTERTIVDKKKEIRCLGAESKGIQVEIDLLANKKEALDDKTKRLVEDVDQLEKKKTTLIAHVRERFEGSAEKINQRLRFIDTSVKEMMMRSQQGRAMGSTKITIDTESIASLTSISHELEELVRSSRECDTPALVEEIKRHIGGLVLHVAGTGQDLEGVWGSQRVKGSDETKREFKQMKKVSDLHFPRDQPFEIVSKVKLTLGSNLATLRRSESASGADAIFFHDRVSSTFTHKITVGVHPAYDMTVSSTGDLVVVRGEQNPPIRVFNPKSGAYRDVNINKEVIDKLHFVETDESENMFVSSGRHLCVLNHNGIIIQHVELNEITFNMAFCAKSRVLNIAAEARILRFRWRNYLLEEISPSSHGVEGFLCCEVCIGSGGEVLVVGEKETEVVIYQVTEGTNEEDFVWRQVTYQGSVRAISISPPHIYIKDNNIWLGHDDKVEKFQLLCTGEQ